MRREEDRSPADAEGESTISLRDLFAMLRRRARLIAFVSTIVTLAAVAVVVLWPNRYEAIAVIQLDPRHKTVTQFEGVYENLKSDTPTIESEAEIAVSGPVLRAVMERLDLVRDPELTEPGGPLVELYDKLGWAKPRAPLEPRIPATSPRPPSNFEQLSGARGASGDLAREPALIAFASRLSARRLRNTQLIEIRYSSRDPVKAARVATAIAEEYIFAQIATKREASSVANSLLEARIRELSGKLAQSERAIEAFKHDVGVYQADGGALTERQLSREMENIVEARKRTATAKARYEQAHAALSSGALGGVGTGAILPASAVPEMFRSPTLRTLGDEVDKAQRRSAETRQKYGPLHPERQRAEAEVAKARSLLKAEIANVVATARADHAIAEQSERQLDADLARLKADISRIKEREWQLRALEREAKTSREIYEHLLSRRKQTAESADLQIADARVIDRAVVPLRPASPKRKQIVIAAALGGVLLALGLAFLLETMQPGIVRRDQAERDLELPVITSVTELSPSVAADPDAERHDLVRSNPTSDFSESVREIRHAVDDGRPHGARRIVMLASALPGEGKSLFAANLALLYATSGSRTLLIDADLRRGSLTHQIGAVGVDGLAELLAGSRLESCLQHSADTGLSFLASSRSPNYAVAAGELLASPRMSQAMARLGERFDTIVIDTPPLLPVVDARVLATLADDIVLVTAWRRTPRDLIRRALRSLGSNEEKVLGLVLNQVGREEQGRAAGYTSEQPSTLVAMRRRAA